MSKLVIVESPSKARTVSKYLDSLPNGKTGDYSVHASVGHVRDLPKSNKNAIDIEGGFVPHYEIVKGKESVLAELKKLAKKAGEVLLATDPDREGEAIAWHLFVALDLEPRKTKRIVFHEITKDAVLEAVKHPRDIDEHLRRAQEARRVLDRLVGYNLSELIWKKIRYGLSAGRVQSPALRILMEREREIRTFKPEDYWVIFADTKTPRQEPLILTCSEEPHDEKEARRICNVGREGSWQVTDAKETRAKRSPRPPFITSTLQQAASTRLGFAPARTMYLAQRLYEAGHITYMRTDSTALAASAAAQIATVVKKKYGKEYHQPRTYKTSSKAAQEAHEAIRPTNASKERAGATEEQKKLYTLIWQRAVASQMKDAQLAKTKVVANITGAPPTGGIPDFVANGSREVFDGWLRADPRARGEDAVLPEVAEGETLSLVEMRLQQKQTQPPPRYTEAGLIRELEKRGIGRPSTYATIMKTLVDRGYVTREGRTLFPTDTGDVVSTFLENNFATYVSDTFTAEMEDELDDIANGKREYEKTLRDFYKPFKKDVESKEHIEKLTTLGDGPKEFPCPKCESPMVVKLGRGGKFLSCSRFPECHGARTIDGVELALDEPIGVHPQTGEEIHLMNGRFGPYVQLGQKGKDNPKPKRASVPKDKDLSEVTCDDAVKYLSLPRTLGIHPKTSKEVVAGIGRFGPFVVHDGDFRSLKNDDVYTIELDRALEILAEEKKTRRRKRAR